MIPLNYQWSLTSIMISGERTVILYLPISGPTVNHVYEHFQYVYTIYMHICKRCADTKQNYAGMILMLHANDALYQNSKALDDDFQQGDRCMFLQEK